MAPEAQWLCRAQTPGVSLPPLQFHHRGTASWIWSGRNARCRCTDPRGTAHTCRRDTRMWDGFTQSFKMNQWKVKNNLYNEWKPLLVTHFSIFNQVQWTSHEGAQQTNVYGGLLTSIYWRFLLLIYANFGRRVEEWQHLRSMPVDVLNGLCKNLPRINVIRQQRLKNRHENICR